MIKNPDCGCIIHPGETHEEHMDRFDREQNEKHVKAAIGLIRNAKSYGEHAHATALLHYGATQEIARLQNKERNMLAGKIRTKK